MLLRRYEAVEVLIPPGSTNTRFQFPDQSQLRNALINSIQVIMPATVSVSPNSFSLPAPIADMKRCFLTLYSGDVQLVYNIPVVQLNNTVDAASPYVFNLPDMNNLVVSWTKSFIAFSQAVTANADQQAVSFGVYYTLPG